MRDAVMLRKVVQKTMGRVVAMVHSEASGWTLTMIAHKAVCHEYSLGKKSYNGCCIDQVR